VVEKVLSIYEVVGSIPSTQKKKKKKENPSNRMEKL
jgi:hypothetical protein